MKLTHEQHLQFAHAFMLDMGAQTLVNQLPDVEVDDEDGNAIADLAERITIDLTLTDEE